MELTVNLQKKLRHFTLDVNLTIKDEILALLGASGCGKSMTLKCIAGIERPDSGRIVLNGRTLYDSSKGINLPPQERHVGYLFQQYALFPNMTVADNIRFVAVGTKAEKEQAVLENLHRFHLDELADAWPRELSGGQQQRAAFARMLASRPQLLLLDEPFSALDSYLKWQLELELSELLKSFGGAALLVSHDRGEAFRLAERIAVMQNGDIEVIAPRHELFAAPQTRAATLLTGCKNISAARRIDEHHLEATDWHLTLTSAAPVPADLRYVGIRAHYLEARDASGENTFPMEARQVIEDTFSMLIMTAASSEAAAIRWETGKDIWHSLEGHPLYLHFPPDQLILLTR